MPQWMYQCGRQNWLLWPKESEEHLARLRGWQGIANEVSEFLHQCINSFFSASRHSSSSASPPTAGHFHSLPLQVTWTSAGLCDGCPAVSLFLLWSGKQSALWSIIPQRQQEHMGEKDYGRRRDTYRPDEHLYLPSGTKTGPLFTQLRCQHCKPPTDVVYVSWKIHKQLRHSKLEMRFSPQSYFGGSLWDLIFLLIKQ